MTRKEILDQTTQCVCTDREEQYGSPEDSFKQIASLWTIYLGLEVNELDVALMMALLKFARIMNGRFKEDSFVDACGYLACAGEIASKEAKNAVNWCRQTL